MEKEENLNKTTSNSMSMKRFWYYFTVLIYFVAILLWIFVLKFNFILVIFGIVFAFVTLFFGEEIRRSL